MYRRTQLVDLTNSVNASTAHVFWFQYTEHSIIQVDDFVHQQILELHVNKTLSIVYQFLKYYNADKYLNTFTS